MAICPDGNIYCSDFSVNVKQDLLFYDHTIGLRDSIAGFMNLKEDAGARNKQGVIARGGVKIIQGSLSFPLTNIAPKAFFNLAKTGDDFDISFYYTCNDSIRAFAKCKVNSYTFRVTAGEIATVSVDIIGCELGSPSSSTRPPSVEGKLITWDQFSVGSSEFSSTDVASLEFTINNNCIPIYTSKSNDTNSLLPKEIRVGMQKLTGAIGIYGVPRSNSISGDGTVQIGGLMNETLEVIYLPTESNGQTGVVVTSCRFVGRDHNIT
jgi:hypothetical protein